MNNQEHPLISVIVPIYNAEKYLDRCIDSICNQSYKNLEIILVNDGSKDNSLAICNTFASKDHRIQIIDISNQGVSNARNTGLKTATGDFIQFLDSDDFMTKEYIETLYDCMQNNEGDYVICGIKSLNNELEELDYWEAGNHAFDMKTPDEDVLYQLFDKFLMFGPVNKLYKRGLLQKSNIFFDTSLSYGEDLLFNLEYLKLTSRIVVTNKVYWSYIQDNVNSLSKKRLNDKIEIVERLHTGILNFLKEIGIESYSFKSLLHNRMFDYVYNDMFAIAKDKSLDDKAKRLNLKKLLNNKMLIESYPYVDTKKYAGWIIFLMKNKLSTLYVLITKILFK
ncbi:glycosyltransferase family 2 protein [Aquimarina gracilis]|uniref:Glycosyltransferase family 2 protein n=1 Tax=Aquimarina gracilis TaxID=874422 RepID=A0ABU6A286_9FLAO|nr:glycosyltransferase family 2 protein [Aquimarina gracilis]MEB3348183.1 glycosyltransferase family 2 protein [Aquimarina gracilis]